MKTIFRTFNLGLILATIFAFGAVATFAQDPCIDLDGQNGLYDKFLAAYNVKTIAGRKQWVELGKQYVEKYGACQTNETVRTNSTYFNTQIPKWEAGIKQMQAVEDRNRLTARFDNAVKAKNFDEIYASGKEILQKYPEEFRSAEIVLATVAGEEAFKANNKYNDEGLKFIKQSIGDLEANRSFKIGDKDQFGIGIYGFPNREDALGWLNLYAGYITAVGQKNKQGAIPYLYKASQTKASDASKNAVVYELIGSYYFDQLNKIVEEIKLLSDGQGKAGITEDELKALIEQIKGKVAISNGTSERAMDAYARAFTFAKDATIKARMKKNVEDAYKLRFGNTTGLDAWMTSALAKPFINPTTPVTPISDPEPVKTAAAPTTGTPATTVVNNTTTVKPAAESTTKPVTPTATAPKKPKAVIKKAVKKKRA